MARVITDHGIILFDIISENCLEPDLLEKWFKSNHYYPVILPRQFVVDYFHQSGVNLINSFFSPTGPGKSEYLIFSPAEP
jgi:hypothetical protein